MAIQEVGRIWRSGLLKEAFDEHKACMKEIYALADEILISPPGAHDMFKVSMGDIPQEYFSVKKNIFSTLFQSVYRLLGIPEERRLLYGKLNYLFRVWVTSADNLLDDEDKVVIPIDMPGKSRVMRQVISVMSADRIMKSVLDDAVERSVISQKDSKTLSDMSLRILLPSAAEEASEEEGVIERPEPGYILSTIHRLKTGFLFQVPFLGPEHVEVDIDTATFNKCKEALDKFGSGCQILDDIRDIARDHMEKRHNYILSKICREGNDNDISGLDSLVYNASVDTKVFYNFSEFVYPAAELAENLLEEGLFLLDEAGLGLGEVAIKSMAASMFDILDVGGLKKCSIKQKTLV